MILISWTWVHHFISALFKWIKTYPFWFTPHLLAGYHILGLRSSNFPTNTGAKVVNHKCLSLSFWSPAWFYCHVTRATCDISSSWITSELIKWYFRLTSSMDAILCQDGRQTNFPGCANHVAQLGVILVITFTICSPFVALAGTIWQDFDFRISLISVRGMPNSTGKYSDCQLSCSGSENNFPWGQVVYWTYL
jgi:hypothetical protein